MSHIHRDSFAPFVGTPPEYIDNVLTLAGITDEDVLCDLGSGDGRLPIIAVQKYGARRGIGVEIEEDLIQRARTHAETRGVSDKVEFLGEDVSNFDPEKHGITILTLYLLPDSFPTLLPLLEKFLELGGNRRVICISWRLPRFQFSGSVEAGAESTATSTTIYRYDSNSYLAEK